jgi:hypothetical protein
MNTRNCGEIKKQRREIMGKKRFLGLMIFAALAFTTMALQAQSVEFFEPFNVYTDKNARDNHFSPSGWMGDYSDITFTDAWKDNPHSGISCIRVEYKPNASQGARWTGMYWQNPPNNWGEKKGGYDLTGAKKLTFWARGEKGGERVEEVKIGGLSGTYPDSDVATTGPIILTKDWQQYSINLDGKDLSYISGGFVWATNLDVNPNGCTFYLDDIRYE